MVASVMIGNTGKEAGKVWGDIGSLISVLNMLSFECL